jgi:16S rRNA (cytosine1402-N4)-methyltransferase
MSELGQGPAPRHVPVLPAQVLHLLAPAPGQLIVDATVGLGGHSRLLADLLGPAGRLVGLDQDAAMLELARPHLAGPNVTLVHASFARLGGVLRDLGLGPVDGVLADLGVCSAQLDDPARGFSFSAAGPLDMRMNPDEAETARDLLLRLNERDLADLIYTYGEERFSRRIARRIVEARRRAPLDTTEELADLVRRCVPRPRRKPGQRPPIDPATRVFQALRIAVNDELRALDRLLETLPDIVRPGGRAVLISFHSLEDRKVKQAFRDRAVWQELTRKPLTADDEETAANPRARSAKLRAAVRAGVGGPERETNQDGGAARGQTARARGSWRTRERTPPALQEESTDVEPDEVRLDGAGRDARAVRHRSGLQDAGRQPGAGRRGDPGAAAHQE